MPMSVRNLSNKAHPQHFRGLPSDYLREVHDRAGADVADLLVVRLFVTIPKMLEDGGHGRAIDELRDELAWQSASCKAPPPNSLRRRERVDRPLIEAARPLGIETVLDSDAARALMKHPGRLVMLSDRARVLARSDRPETMPR